MFVYTGVHIYICIYFCTRMFGYTYLKSYVRFCAKKDTPLRWLRSTKLKALSICVHVLHVFVLCFLCACFPFLACGVCATIVRIVLTAVIVSM